MNYILVVDDSLVDRQLVGGLLQRSTNYSVEYASNGLEALELMETNLPLAVVTDLRMPELDGMGLVQAMRQRFPTVPVILMTAHGSEDIAVQALSAGAADYVPKSRLASDLNRSIESVLTISTVERARQRVTRLLRYEELEYELENDVQLIPPVVAHLEEAAADFGLLDKPDRVRLGKALAEALRNAIYHGNLELSAEQVEAAARPSSPAADLVADRQRQLPYRDRRVQVRGEFSSEEARFRIRDEGPGFDIGDMPNVKTHPEHLSGNGGRGLVLIRMFVDDVSFSPAGNEITLVKRRGARL